MRILLRKISVVPFKGYAPNPLFAQQLLSPPYVVINTAEARVLAENNEKSFLHCIRPEIDFLEPVDAYSTEVYKKGRENLELFIKNNWLIQDTQKRIYAYCITSGNHSQYGILSGSSVKEYENKIIKTHEMTREVKVSDRKKLIDIQNANSEPVFLMYRHKDAIDEIIHNISKNKPVVDVVTNDGIHHVL